MLPLYTRTLQRLGQSFAVVHMCADLAGLAVCELCVLVLPKHGSAQGLGPAACSAHNLPYRCRCCCNRLAANASIHLSVSSAGYSSPCMCKTCCSSLN